MMNLVRMYLYRLLHTRSIYVMSFVLILMVAFVTIDEGSEQSQQAEQQLLEEQGVDAENTRESVGIVMTPLSDVTKVSFYQEFMGSGVLLLFLSIFTALLSYKERDGGFLKNLNSCAKKRGYIFLAKVPAVIAFVSIQFLTLIVMLQIMCRGHANGDMQYLVWYIVSQFLLHIAFGTFILMIMELTRNLAAGLMTGIFFSIGIHILLLSMVENVLLGLGLPEKLLPSQYLIVSQVKMLMADGTGNGLFLSIIIGVVALILYLALGMWIFNKRDIY